MGRKSNARKSKDRKSKDPKSKGKGNPEEGSQSGVVRRRSSRLSSDPATNMSQSSDPATNMSQSSESVKPPPPTQSRQSVKPPPPNFIYASKIGPWFIDDRGTPEQTAERNREMRQLRAKPFEYSYQRFGSDKHKDRFIKETKHIVASNNVTLTSTERSHGIPWVAVHGVHSICAVYKQDLSEVARICGFLKQHLAIQHCGEYLLSEMEDLAVSKDLAGKPFAVVSLNSFSNDVKESCDKQAHVPDKDMAIGFLMSKLETNSAISEDDTIQIAIGAFQQLFKQEFKAEEINVYFFVEQGFVEEGFDGYLMKSHVELHLAAVKQQQSTLQWNVEASEDV